MSTGVSTSDVHMKKITTEDDVNIIKKKRPIILTAYNTCARTEGAINVKKRKSQSFSVVASLYRPRCGPRRRSTL